MDHFASSSKKEASEGVTKSPIRMGPMITQFAEIAFLSDRDLVRLLQEIDNKTLQIALYECDQFVRERIFRQFSYVGWKLFETDRALFQPSSPSEITSYQEAIIDITNGLIEDREFQDYFTSMCA